MRGSNIYFAVPEHYTIGDRFDTFAEADAAARARIRPLTLDGIAGHSRAFVDCRIEDADGDRPLHRVEVFPG